MGTPVSTIRNLGPAMEAAFARAGIASAEDLRALGADAAYAKLLQAGERAHFIAYYALVMGLDGRPWTTAAARKRPNCARDPSGSSDRPPRRTA